MMDAHRLMRLLYVAEFRDAIKFKQAPFLTF